MNEGDRGFFITRLTVSGSQKGDALLEFTDGLNVVSGASDTGKSFALSCIDFAFGARDAPRSIPEAKGYESVTLQLTSRATGDQFAIVRGLAGGDVRVRHSAANGPLLTDSVVPFRHNAKDPETLSGILLKLSDLWGRQVRKNSKGERRSLSFRDVAYLCVVDEERIIAERPPHLSDSYYERTVEGQVLRTLVTGNESGEVIVVPGKEHVVGIDAKLDFIASMIESGLSDFQRTGLSESKLDQELTQIEEARRSVLAEYDRARVSVTDLEEQLQETTHTLRETQTRRAIIDGLSKRFRLLDDHYSSNVKRLAAIEEAGSLLEALPSKPCPLCGAVPEDHRFEHADERYQPSTVHAAARSEAAKVMILKGDLGKVLGELANEDTQLQTRVSELTASANAIQGQINDELMPRVTESAQALKVQNERRDLLLRGKGILENIAKLRRSAVELEATRVAGKAPPPKIATIATTAEMDTFSRQVESLLTAWHYPDPGRVMFSETTQDLIIGGHPRASHGKGVRALTCAAFIIGIMRHCRVAKLPHPSTVILDSPLVAYQEPDIVGTDAHQLRQAGVKEAFYSSLASGVSQGQVIIFENEDPPDTLKQKFTSHHFTKTNTGRYGFFPRS